MKHFEINGTLRTGLGKKATKSIRKGENIPCVIYGGEKNINFQTSFAAVRKFIYTPEVMFADLKIEDKVYVSLVKDIQFDPVTDQILHIDFYEIHPEKPIKIQIPLKIIGNSIGVKSGGKIKQNFRKITVKGLEQHIPDFFEADITPLKIGQAIRVKDLQSDNLEFVDSKSSILVTIVSTRGASGEGGEGEAEQAAAE